MPKSLPGFLPIFFREFLARIVVSHLSRHSEKKLLKNPCKISGLNIKRIERRIKLGNKNWKKIKKKTPGETQTKSSGETSKDIPRKPLENILG